MLVDSHAHLNFPELALDLPQILSRAQDNGIEKIVCVGTAIDDSRLAVEIAQKHDEVYATVGIHPNDNLEINLDNIDWEEFKKLAQEPKVVAIGECGLDFSRLPEGTAERELEIVRQKKLFLKQIELATQLGLPLSVHIRDAYKETTQIFKQIDEPVRGVFHCFSGDLDYLEFIIKELPGFYVSFAGNLTFKKADNLRLLAKEAPLSRIMVETDAPFLAPEGLRGKLNEPANVKITAMELARVKGVDFALVASQTSENVAKLFGL